MTGIANLAPALDWIMSANTSPSSYALCAVVCGKTPTDRRHPQDAVDFGKCMHFLREVPQAKAYLFLAANISQEWARLVSRWTELEQLFIDEIGIAYDKGVNAVRTTALLQAVVAGVDMPVQDQFS